MFERVDFYEKIRYNNCTKFLGGIYMYTYLICYRISATKWKGARIDSCVLNCNEPINSEKRVREVEDEIQLIKEKASSKTGKVKIINIVLLNKD